MKDEFAAKPSSRQANHQRRKWRAIMALLEEQNPAPKTELIYTTDFSLLVAVILSAQATDAAVNKIMKQNIERIDSPKKIVDLGGERIQDLFKSLNLYKNKSKHIMQTSFILIEKHDSRVPLLFEKLVALPGVGRKTANVVLNTLANSPRIAVDTHVSRVCARIGLAAPILGKRGVTWGAENTELALYNSIPKKYWTRASNWLVLHGRYVCKARKPLCESCCLRALCGEYTKKPH
jgi:endonuclease-3